MVDFDSRVNPSHYKRTDGMECIDIIEAYNLNFSRGCTLKYICRAGDKPEEGMTAIQKEYEDLLKGRWYLDREIARLKELLDA